MAESLWGDFGAASLLDNSKHFQTYHISGLGILKQSSFDSKLLFDIDFLFYQYSTPSPPPSPFQKLFIYIYRYTQKACLRGPNDLKSTIFCKTHWEGLTAPHPQNLTFTLGRYSVVILTWLHIKYIKYSQVSEVPCCGYCKGFSFCHFSSALVAGDRKTFFWHEFSLFIVWIWRLCKYLLWIFLGATACVVKDVFLMSLVKDALKAFDDFKNKQQEYMMK